MKNPEKIFGVKAGGQGFEPRLTVPETAVLPLDEPPPAKGILSFLSTLVKSIQKSMLKFGDRYHKELYYSLLLRKNIHGRTNGIVRFYP